MFVSGYTSPHALLATVLGLLWSAAASPTDYWVAPGGSDAGPGSQGTPWATLQHAADTVQAGDTVHVLAATYAGFDLRTSGASAQPIRFLAQPGVVIDSNNPLTPDGINLEGTDWVRIEGFTVEGTGRAGIRAVLCERVDIIGNHLIDNQRWGIFTGFCDDLLIAGNEAEGSIDEHGIYVSNSGDRPVIRDNYLHGNAANGVHMNGDVSQGGDGVISGALVERNVIVDNGESGGSGVNCDGVQDSVIRNNLIVGNHASGISLYRTDGGGPSTGNVVVHNTVVNDSDGRWGLTVRDAATDNTLLYNILISRHGYRGAIDVHTDSLPGLVSDYNVVEDRFTTDSGDSVILTLTEWQTQTGLDANSLVASEAALFVNPTLPSGDYHLKVGAPAVDAAIGPSAAGVDFERDPRPFGAAADIGADEWLPPCTLADDDLVVTSHTVTGEETHESCATITAGPSLTISGSGDLTLRTRRRVSLLSGVVVAAGGELHIRLDPSAGAP